MSLLVLSILTSPFPSLLVLLRRRLCTRCLQGNAHMSYKSRSHTLQIGKTSKLRNSHLFKVITPYISLGCCLCSQAATSDFECHINANQNNIVKMWIIDATVAWQCGHYSFHPRLAVEKKQIVECTRTLSWTPEKANYPRRELEGDRLLLRVLSALCARPRDNPRGLLPFWKKKKQNERYNCMKQGSLI